MGPRYKTRVQNAHLAAAQTTRDGTNSVYNQSVLRLIRYVWEKVTVVVVQEEIVC